RNQSCASQERKGENDSNGWIPVPFRQNVPHDRRSDESTQVSYRVNQPNRSCCSRFPQSQSRNLPEDRTPAVDPAANETQTKNSDHEGLPSNRRQKQEHGSPYHRDTGVNLSLAGAIRRPARRVSRSHCNTEGNRSTQIRQKGRESGTPLHNGWQP